MCRCVCLFSDSTFRCVLLVLASLGPFAFCMYGALLLALSLAAGSCSLLVASSFGAFVLLAVHAAYGGVGVLFVFCEIATELLAQTF